MLLFNYYYYSCIIQRQSIKYKKCIMFAALSQLIHLKRFKKIANGKMMPVAQLNVRTMCCVK